MLKFGLIYPQYNGQKCRNTFEKTIDSSYTHTFKILYLYTSSYVISSYVILNYTSFVKKYMKK